MVNADRSAHDEIAESWTHIEIARARHGRARAITADLHRILGDVRVAVEDYPRMRQGGAARRPAPAREPKAAAGRGWRPRDAPGETAALLRWLTDGHFTFLGYSEYDLQDGPTG